MWFWGEVWAEDIELGVTGWHQEPRDYEITKGLSADRDGEKVLEWEK